MALEAFVTLNNLVLSPLGFPHLEHQDPYACLGGVRGRITRKECLRWCLKEHLCGRPLPWSQLQEENARI